MTLRDGRDGAGSDGWLRSVQQRRRKQAVVALPTKSNLCVETKCFRDICLMDQEVFSCSSQDIVAGHTSVQSLKIANMSFGNIEIDKCSGGQISGSTLSRIVPVNVVACFRS